MECFADFSSAAPFTASSGVDATCSVAALRRSSQTKAAPLLDAQDDDARRFATLRMAMHTPDAQTPAASKPYNLQTSPVPEAEEQIPTQAPVAAVAQEADTRDPAVLCSIALSTPLTVKPPAPDSKPAKQFGSLQEELAAVVKARQAAAASHQQLPNSEPETLSSQNGTTSQQASQGMKGPPPAPPLPPKACKKQANLGLQKGGPAPPPPPAPAPPRGSLSAAKKPVSTEASTPAKMSLADKPGQAPKASGASQPAKVRDMYFSWSALSKSRVQVCWTISHGICI